jgi:hypothetical protein
VTDAVGAATARRLTPQRILETAATTASGAALAGIVWSLVDLATAAALVGGANGAISGTRRIYRWRSPAGWVAFALDSTWALFTTAAALVAHGLAFVQRSPRNYVGELSLRRNRHVYERGYTLRRGFVLTIGNVVNGAGPTAHDDPRRQHIVEHHEDVHVWQARWFGPLFPIVYGGWWVMGALAGLGVWIARRPAEGLGKTVDSFAYYRNPFEWWAYSREGRWPPPHAVARFVWPRPLARKS